MEFRDDRPLQFQYAERNAVDVQDDVRRLGAGLGIDAFDRHFLGNRKVVGLRILPVDQPHRLVVLAGTGAHLHAIAQQPVDLLVAVIEVLAGVAGQLLQLKQGAVDQRTVYSKPL